MNIFSKAYLGGGTVSWNGLLYSFAFMTVIVFLGIVIFYKVEATFMDTV